MSTTNDSRGVELTNTPMLDPDQLVNSIDQEILELEELINLQRRKVELLRKKNAITVDRESNKRNHNDDSSCPIKLKPIQIPDKIDIVPSAHEEPPVSPTSKQLSMISSMQRMSRLTTDLANERNMLSWGRTAMTAARTSVAFISLRGTTEFGVGLVYTTTIGFGVIAVWMVVQGTIRYKKIKNILLLPEPPLQFHRLSNMPVISMLLALLILLVIGNSADQWSK